MIFLDTSAIYAILDVKEELHDHAFSLLKEALENGEEFVTHNYVLSESAALIHRRLGAKEALAFLKTPGSMTIIWIDNLLHAEAVHELEIMPSSKISFVDAASFVVMRECHIDTYLGFDKHFSDMGFKQYNS
jgi:predicted nucleic acid-binding protein